MLQNIIKKATSRLYVQSFVTWTILSSQQRSQAQKLWVPGENLSVEEDKLKFNAVHVGYVQRREYKQSTIKYLART